MAMIIDGKKVSTRIKEEVKQEVLALKEKGVKVGLAVIIVGDDPASRVYVNNKKKACEACEIYSEEYALPAETQEKEVLELIDSLNKRDDISGILVQLPLPKHIDEKKVINSIIPEKDVDAFHPVNVGKIMIGDFDFLPCTPAGVMELLLHENGTVTICHSRTKDLKEVTKRAEILVAAVGIPKFVKADMVKEGAVVIDVGINRDENGKLCGDVDFDDVEKVASAITPVPGGVGPMTIAMLMRNTLTAAKKMNNE